MRIRKHRILTVFIAAMLLFSNVAWAVGFCIMDVPQPNGAVQVHDVPHQAAAVAGHDDPCCDTQESKSTAPDGCCAVLGAEHFEAAVPALVTYSPPVLPPLHIVAVAASGWGVQRLDIAAPPPREAGPPLNLLFKNFRI